MVSSNCSDLGNSYSTDNVIPSWWRHALERTDILSTGVSDLVERSLLFFPIFVLFPGFKCVVFFNSHFCKPVLAWLMMLRFLSSRLGFHRFHFLLMLLQKPARQSPRNNRHWEVLQQRLGPQLARTTWPTQSEKLLQGHSKLLDADSHFSFAYSRCPERWLT